MVLFPIYFPIILGIVVRVSGYVPTSLAPFLRQFCLKITIPLLVFTQMAHLDADLLGQVLPLTLSLPLWMFLTWLVAWPVSWIPVFRRRRFEAILALTMSNIGYIGWAVCDIALNDPGLTRSIMFGVLIWPVIVTMAFLTQVILERNMHGVQKGLQTLKICIPVLVAFLAGWLLAVLHVRLPEDLMAPLTQMGEMTPPLILFGVGLSIQLEWRRDGYLWLLLCRLAMGMGAAWLVVHLVKNLDEVSRQVILIVSTMPVAANTLIMGEIMDLDESWLAGAVAVTTAAALFTIPLVLYLFARYGGAVLP